MGSNPLPRMAAADAGERRNAINGPAAFGSLASALMPTLKVV